MYNYKGITTNNLKDISVNFDDYEIIYVGGISGSGKSSLVFDTIAAISENEYGSLNRDNKIAVKFRIKEYETVLVAASLRQLNFNANPRSIILTYFGLFQHMANILSQCTHMTADSFSLNGACRCRKCNGIGYINIIDELLVVEPEKTLKEEPFRCWNTSYSDFFSQLLHNFCEEQKLDEDTKFNKLPEKTQQLLLRGRGKTKYKIYYTVGGRKRTKTTTYIGPILGLESGMKDMFGTNIEKFSKLCICHACKGSRLTEQVSEQNVFKSINVRFMLTESMDQIEPILKEIRRDCKNQSLRYSCDCLLRFIEASKRLNVSYLNFSRAISTLSGGELQRLRMVQLFLGKLKNLLIVLDEPTSSLDSKEVDSIISIILKLKENNTILVVDHNEKVRKIADRIYYLGPKSGIRGGELISEDAYLKLQEADIKPYKITETEKVSVILKSDYVDYADNLDVYLKSLNGITGASGIGKSIILRDILPYQMDEYKYITQKPIKANRNSTVASYTGLLNEVKDYYVSITKRDKKFFSLFQDGACSKCDGKGVISIGDFYDEQLFIDCEECDGTGYAKHTLKYAVGGLNICEFLNQNIEEIIEKGISVSKKFDNTIQLLAKLGLGHLSLNQKIMSLSGGENQRIKLSQALGEGRTKIYGLDEPSKGLGRKEMLNLINVIYENIEKKEKTFIVSEHNPEFLKLCSHVSVLRKTESKVYVDTRSVRC